LWAALSDASFGIYLVHPLFLREAQGRIVPLLTGVSPWLILTFLCVFTCVASTVATLLLLRTPLLSRTVGREGPARQPQRASEPQRAPQPQAEAHAGPRAG
jgi:peptidoglycan/LPS O-acetylase OafA/YrhL